MTNEQKSTFEKNVKLKGKIVLDRKLMMIIVNMAREGKPIPWVCDMLAIPQPWLHRWIAYAKQFWEDPENNKDKEIFYEFGCRLRRAVKEYLDEVKQRMSHGTNGEWVKFAWVLERLDPKIFARKDPNAQGPQDDGSGADNARFL